MGNWDNQNGLGAYGSSNIDFTHNAKNQRTYQNTGHYTITDAKGNTTLMASTTSTSPGTPVAYDLGLGYDQLNQLSSTRSYYNPVTVTLDRYYRYDALGRRYAKLNTTAANSAGTIYATNPEFRNLACLDNNLNTTWNIVWGRGFNEALLVDGWGQYYYQHGDQIHSTIGVSKANGTIQSFVHYWPYGDFDQVIVQNDLGGYVASATLYSGELYDYETRLSYYGYRYYYPGNGRWINRDPIGESGGMNLYEMVGGGVLNKIDQFGLNGISLGVIEDVVKNKIIEHIADDEICADALTSMLALGSSPCKWTQISGALGLDATSKTGLFESIQGAIIGSVSKGAKYVLGKFNEVLKNKGMVGDIMNQMRQENRFRIQQIGAREVAQQIADSLRLSYYIKCDLPKGFLLTVYASGNYSSKVARMAGIFNMPIKNIKCNYSSNPIMKSKYEQLRIACEDCFGRLSSEILGSSLFPVGNFLTVSPAPDLHF